MFALSNLFLCVVHRFPPFFAGTLDKGPFRRYDEKNIHIMFACRQLRKMLTENRESGQKPERYRHCMRRCRMQGESQPLGTPEKAAYVSMMCKSGDLRKQSACCSPAGKTVPLFCRKAERLPQLFVFRKAYAQCRPKRPRAAAWIAEDCRRIRRRTEGNFTVEIRAAPGKDTAVSQAHRTARALHHNSLDIKGE